MGVTSAKTLLVKWDIPANRAYYHHAGTFFMPLEGFPGALCDANGYVLFRTKAEFDSEQRIRVGQRTNVRGGISTLSGYIRMN